MPDKPRHPKWRKLLDFLTSLGDQRIKKPLKGGVSLFTWWGLEERKALLFLLLDVYHLGLRREIPLG